MESSSIVIKVKFGETLRRFNAFIVDEEFDLDMVRLRKKILSLFNFAPDADFMLTYVDEDGDEVTLADEDDLFDVVRQSLNPLRITVRLNTEKTGRSYARSSGSSTPMKSSQIQHPLQNLNTSVSEILKSVPEPFHDAFSKLSIDLASRATSSAPGLAELVDAFSKMGLIYLNQFSELQAVPVSCTPSMASGRTVGASNVEDQQGSKVDGPLLEKSSGTKSEVLIVEHNEVTPDGVVERISKSAEVGLQEVTEVVETSDGGAASSVNCKANFTPERFHVPICNEDEVKGFGSLWKSGEEAFVNVTQPATDVPAVEKKNDISKSSESRVGNVWNPAGFGASNPDYLRRCLQDSQTTGMDGSIWAKPSNDSGNSSGWYHGMLSPMNECPFSGMPLANDSAVPPLPFTCRVAPFKRSYNHGDGNDSIFHRGVRCDGCGVHPISGPRFKSKVKEDYDLCSICFVAMGNDTDYIRMDFPLNHRQPLPFKGMHDPSRMHPPTLPHVLRGSGWKPSRPRLDSRFIQDVNILDGTIMAPSTPFTKIWRMRNNGTIVWPRGSQLLWIGGDRLSNTFSVEVEIPADGLHVDKELNILVDFTAPELPGRYMSYWRMASPSGQKFGQRVWVLIQVDTSLKGSCQNIHDLNLNLPPFSSDITDPTEIVSVNGKPLAEGSFLEPHNNRVTELVEPTLDIHPKKPFNIRVAELVEPIIDSHPNKDQDPNFLINDTLLVGGGGCIPSTLTPGASCSVSYPIIDFSEGAPTMSIPTQSPSPVVQASATREIGGNRDREETLLRELEEMGFKQVDLNKQILRMNEYNLEQSVDDLCGVAEWDPILEELQEMGFSDKETNKRLLKKNNGSIKRVVMDLIAGEKA